MAFLRFLGTGCGVPMPDRHHASLILESSAGRRILIDAGEPCSHSIRRLDIPFGTFEEVWITHGHSDHIGGLPMFFQSCWLEPRLERLVVRLPGELIGPLRAWLDAVYLPEKLIGFDVEYVAWEERPAPSGDWWRVDAASNTHLEGLARRIDPGNAARFRSYSLGVEVDGKRIVYSGDIGGPEDLAPLLGERVDLLVSEIAHFEPEALIRFLAEREIGELVFTHFPPGGVPRGAAMQRLVRKVAGERFAVRLARDGMEVQIGEGRVQA